MTADLSLFDYAEARAAGEAGMRQVAANAGPEFAELAGAFIPAYLETHGQTHGEDIVDACLARGIVPHNPKAFGPFLLSLSRAGVIEKAGYAPRRKGHLSGQAPIWRLKQ